MATKFKSWRTLVYESDLPALEKSVLHAYLDFDRREEAVAVYPSYALIAWLTGWKLATVKKTILRLRERNILVPVGHVASHQLRGRIVKYSVDVKRLPKRQSWRDSSDRVHHVAPVGRDSGHHVAPVSARQSAPDDRTEATSVFDRGDVTLDRGYVVATDRTSDLYVDRRADQVPRVPRVFPSDENKQRPETEAERLAQEAYRQLVPHARSQLERLARGALRGDLERLSVEEGAALIRRKIIVDLEDRRVREMYGVLAADVATAAAKPSA